MMAKGRVVNWHLSEGQPRKAKLSTNPWPELRAPKRACFGALFVLLVSRLMPVDLRLSTKGEEIGQIANGGSVRRSVRICGARYWIGEIVAAAPGHPGMEIPA